MMLSKDLSAKISAFTDHIQLTWQMLQLKSSIRQAITQSLPLPDNSDVRINGTLTLEVPGGAIAPITLTFADSGHSETGSQSGRKSSMHTTNRPVNFAEQLSTLCSVDSNMTNQMSLPQSTSSTSLADCAYDVTKEASVPSSLQETPVIQESMTENEVTRLNRERLLVSASLELLKSSTILPTMLSATYLKPHSITPSGRKRRRVGERPARKTGEVDEVKCNQCDGVFNSHRTLERHTRESHGGFKCHLCGKPIAQFPNLRRHFLIHLDFKPFECILCGKAYNRKDHLMRHMKKTHPLLPAEENIRVRLRPSKSLEYLRQRSETHSATNIDSQDGNSTNEPLQIGDTLGSEDGGLAVMERVMKADANTLRSPTNLPTDLLFDECDPSSPH